MAFLDHEAFCSLVLQEELDRMAEDPLDRMVFCCRSLQAWLDRMVSLGRMVVYSQDLRAEVGSKDDEDQMDVCW